MSTPDPSASRSRNAGTVAAVLTVAIVAALAFLFTSRPSTSATHLVVHPGTPTLARFGPAATTTDVATDTPQATDTPTNPTATLQPPAPTATPAPIPISFPCADGQSAAGDPSTIDAELCAQAPADVSDTVTITLEYCGHLNQPGPSFHLAGGASTRYTWSFQCGSLPITVTYSVSAAGFSGSGSFVITH